MNGEDGEGGVLLVAMPWAQLEHPSLQIGLLKSVLAAAGLRAATRSCFLEFMEFAAQRSDLSPLDYDAISNHHFIGEWIFSVPPFNDTRNSDIAYFEYL